MAACRCLSCEQIPAVCRLALSCNCSALRHCGHLIVQLNWHISMSCLVIVCDGFLLLHACVFVCSVVMVVHSCSFPALLLSLQQLKCISSGLSVTLFASHGLKCRIWLDPTWPYILQISVEAGGDSGSGTCVWGGGGGVSDDLQ